VLHLFNFATWSVAGAPERLSRLAASLRERAGIAHVTAFGNTLHIAGEDEAALEAAIAPFRDEADLSWRRAEASLEDVFIHLMAGAADNYQ
jgi:ABC-2 type transport system ATP-binding protein